MPRVAEALRVQRRGADADSAAITFDDGPHELGTPAVLEALREAGAEATFFLVGEQVERYPALAAEIAAAGHSVAVHGYNHRLLLRLTPRQFGDDLDRAVAAIEDATGRACELYRPPYGIFSVPGLAAVRRRGLTPILWSRWGHDWRRRTNPEGVAAEVTENLEGGDVLLLHDADHYSAPGCWRVTAAAVPLAVAAIKAAGLRPAAI